MLYLAEVLLRCGSSPEARKNLYRCLKSRDCKMKAQLLLGESYAREGQHRRAKSWFEKVLEQKNGRQDLQAEAEKSLNEILRKTR
jgi:Tfp pilus assembly protein PilF